MGISISKSEKIDIFLALALHCDFEVNIDGEKDSQSKNLEFAFSSFSNFNSEDIGEFKQRAKRFGRLSPQKKKQWQKFWLEKLKLHGQTQRLDAKIHSEQIVEVLKDEPLIIQEMIVKNLPRELAIKVTKLLPNSEFKTKNNNEINNKKISKIVRNKFLSNFVAFEDIYQANSLDELTLDGLEKYIWDLGIRETAIACRGVKTKESLAIFLKPFDEKITKEIALKINELKNLEPERVLYAELLVSTVSNSNKKSSYWISELGLLMLAQTYAFREDYSKRFLMQKFPILTAEKIDKFITLFETNKIEYIVAVSDEICQRVETKTRLI